MRTTLRRIYRVSGKTLAEAVLGQHAGVTVIGQWVGGKLTSPPAADMRLVAGGILVLVGSDGSIREFMRLCARARQLRRDGPFLIARGGEVGRKVAQLLNDCGEKTFMIDTQPSPGVDLVGNVLDEKILRQADLQNVQAVILALGADVTTLFNMVIVRDMAPDVPVIARVNRAENVDRLNGAGADFALSISQVCGQLLALRLLGKESVAVDSDLQVAKVSMRGLENHHPKQPQLREQAGCSVVAVERGAELQVEFRAKFSIQTGDAEYICGSGDAVQKFYQKYPQK